MGYEATVVFNLPKSMPAHWDVVLAVMNEYLNGRYPAFSVETGLLKVSFDVEEDDKPGAIGAALTLSTQAAKMSGAPLGYPTLRKLIKNTLQDAEIETFLSSCEKPE